MSRRAWACAWVLAGQPRRGLSVLDTLLERSHGVPAGRILIRRVGAFWVLGRNAEALRDAQAAVGLLSGAGDLVWEARAAALAGSGVPRHGRYRAGRPGLRPGRDAVRRMRPASWSTRPPARNADWPHTPAATCPPRWPTSTTPRPCSTELGIFEADLFVNKCTVLLAAGLARDALGEVDAAVARIEQDHGSATRRAELLYSSALAAVATGDFGLAQDRSAEALRLFRRQQRPWWAARAELVLLLCRFAEEPGSPAAPCCRRPGG